LDLALTLLDVVGLLLERLRSSGRIRSAIQGLQRLRIQFRDPLLGRLVQFRGCLCLLAARLDHGGNEALLLAGLLKLDRSRTGRLGSEPCGSVSGQQSE